MLFMHLKKMIKVGIMESLGEMVSMRLLLAGISDRSRFIQPQQYWVAIF